MHEENFLISLLRKDLIGKQRKVNERAGAVEENRKKRKRKEMWRKKRTRR